MVVRLSEDESLSLIAGARVARLGCIVDGGPYVVPINCYYAAGSIYSHSLPGQKISALRKNPKACLQFDKIESDLQWRSVLAFGNYEEISNPVERSDILNKLLQRFPMLTPVESAIAEDAGYPTVIVYRIRVERITGVPKNKSTIHQAKRNHHEDFVLLRIVAFIKIRKFLRPRREPKETG